MVKLYLRPSAVVRRSKRCFDKGRTLKVQAQQRYLRRSKTIFRRGARGSTITM